MVARFSPCSRQVQKVLEDANDDYNLSHTAQMNLVFFQEGIPSCGTVQAVHESFCLAAGIIHATLGEGWDSFYDYCSCPSKPVLTSASISITITGDLPFLSDPISPEVVEKLQETPPSLGVERHGCSMLLQPFLSEYLFLRRWSGNLVYLPFLPYFYQLFLSKFSSL